jgi:hypothetical protein
MALESASNAAYYLTDLKKGDICNHYAQLYQAVKTSKRK